MKWLAFAMSALVGLPLLVWAVSSALSVPTEQAQALQAMTEPAAARPPAQDNAFAAIWLLAYDGVPTDQWDALVAEDVARHQQAVANDTGEDVQTSVAADRFAQVTRHTLRCRRNAGSCLAQVREDPAAAAADHAGHDALHERLAALTAYGHYRSAFVPEPNMPFADFPLLMDRTSAHALAHVRGDTAAALQGVCEDTSTGRMLMRSSDSLIMAAIGGAIAERSASLFTDILAELPAEVPLPAVCATAFAPPQVSEQDLCQPLRGEFAFQASGMTAAKVEYYQRPFFSERKTQAHTAWLLSRSCDATVQARIRADLPVYLPAPPSVWNLQCAGNLVGCVLMGIDSPDYAFYVRRMQDNGAQLRLAAMMLWLRQQPRMDGANNALTTLRDLPPGLESPSRVLRGTPEGDHVELQRYERRDADPARLRAALPLGWRAAVSAPACARPA